MKDKSFKDHFSAISKSYNHFRPGYPDSMFSYLASVSPTLEKAWDCATGNGQSARMLKNHFIHVIATDASEDQILHAPQCDNILYKRATAEDCGLTESSIDLITVAQAIHWFKLSDFFNEADRVLKNEGILAVWTYNLLRINKKIDCIIDFFYYQILKGCWPKERLLVEADYKDIQFPFSGIQSPAFSMSAQWSLEHLIGYLRTWSGTNFFIKNNDHDPIKLIQEDLIKAWGESDKIKKIKWDLALFVRKKN